MSLKMLTRRCRKCGGDLYLDKDEDGYYYSCIHCGKMDREMTRRLRDYLRDDTTPETPPRHPERVEQTTAN